MLEGTIDDIRRIRARLQEAVAVFQALPDAELAQFRVGLFGDIESPATVAEIAAQIRSYQAAVVGARIAVLDDYLEVLGRIVVKVSDLTLIEWFIDAWDHQERFLKRWEDIPGIADGVEASEMLWIRSGVPNVAPPQLVTVPEPDDDDEDDEEEEIVCAHVWIRKRQGGPPDMAESLEVVEFCEKCGIEKEDE
jgi:hypothetical protein